MSSLKVPKFRFSRPVVEVFVTHIHGLGILYVQPVVDEQQYNFRDLTNKIGDLKLDTPSGEIQYKSTIYALKLEEDLFYRCVVLKEISNSRVSVVFVDYGNTAIVRKRNLYDLPIELKTYQSSLRKFVLEGIPIREPKDIKTINDREMCKWFNQKLTNKSVQLVQMEDGTTRVLLEGKDIVRIYQLEKMNEVPSPEVSAGPSSVVLDRASLEVMTGPSSGILDRASLEVVTGPSSGELDGASSEVVTGASLEVLADPSTLEKVSKMHGRLTKKRILANKMWRQSNAVVELSKRVRQLSTTTNFADVKSKLDMFEEVFKAIEVLDKIVLDSGSNRCFEDPRKALVESLRTRINAEIEIMVQEGLYQKTGELESILKLWNEIRLKLTPQRIPQDVMESLQEEEDYFQEVIKVAEETLAEWQTSCRARTVTTHQTIMNLCKSPGFETLQQDIKEQFEKLTAKELFKDLSIIGTMIEPVTYSELKKAAIDEMRDLENKGDCFKVVSGLTQLFEDAIVELKTNFDQMLLRINKMKELLVRTNFKLADFGKQISTPVS